MEEVYKRNHSYPPLKSLENLLHYSQTEKNQLL